ncbi:MAG: hypothetical protein NVS9B1_18750 [Candidatus Dormibacteraceae bacterium]
MLFRTAGLATFVVGIVITSAALLVLDANAAGVPAPAPAAVPSPVVVLAVAETPAPPTPEPAPTPTPTPVPSHPSFDPLSAKIQALAAASGAAVGVTLVELAGPAPKSLSVGGATSFDAASTYKLAALMDEAQRIAAGKVDSSGSICFTEADWEDGWYTDYAPEDCYTRSELAARAGHFSDNTAGHMLVRDLGGADSLNAYARSHGATNSELFDNNTTTANDLAALLVAEARGEAGGAAAQKWLYPVLTHTNYEAGIPAGVPGSATVVHKTGELDPVVNDAALVSGGRNGAYVLVVLTDGAGGPTGWSLIASISAAVWQYEAAR